MSRRSTLERIDAARRASTRTRLIGEGVTRERADDWIARSEAEASRIGPQRDGAYWDAGWAWIAAQRR